MYIIFIVSVAPLQRCSSAPALSTGALSPLNLYLYINRYIDIDLNLLFGTTEMTTRNCNGATLQRTLYWNRWHLYWKPHTWFRYQVCVLISLVGCPICCTQSLTRTSFAHVPVWMLVISAKKVEHQIGHPISEVKENNPDGYKIRQLGQQGQRFR